MSRVWGGGQDRGRPPRRTGSFRFDRPRRPRRVWDNRQRLGSPYIGLQAYPQNQRVVR